MRPIWTNPRVLLTGLLCLIGCVQADAQGVQVTTNAKGQLITTFATGAVNHTRYVTYLGTAYLGDAIWHPGSLIYRNQRKIFGQIAYNIEREEVYWRLSDSSAIDKALPDEFTIDGHRFLSNQHKYLGVDRVDYYELLYDGKIRLLRRWVKQLRFIDPKTYSIRVPNNERFDGRFVLLKELYIQKLGERPKFVLPNEYGISQALPNMGNSLASYVASQPLTDSVMVEVVKRYNARTPSGSH